MKYPIALAHRLNAPCPDCSCPQWMHNEHGCLKLRRRKTSGNHAAKVAPLKRCRCTNTAETFA
ncbi:protein CBG06515 [Mycolicibacterium canariasense]|uniref:Protein CBG06515 n=1 Tax=Mycolicibacterium canariasense TaxID=228230 RepID=A0A100WJ55_MYCCR|nr:protein CBG06515 [Mycolicibacterium canariasense]